MLNEQTHQRLLEMKLHGLAAAYAMFLDEKSQDQLSFAERLAMMVDREYCDRQNRRLNRKLGAAKLREQACIEDIDYRHPRNLDRSVMQRLAACLWVKNHDNVIITGMTGLGKTWLACALANKACRENFSVRYVRTSRLLHDLHIASADGTYLRELAKLAKLDVLILDDWGMSALGDNERRNLLEVIEDRSNRRSTIIASQLPVKKWHDHIGDPTIADSILDRLVHNAHRIELVGQRSMRNSKTDESATK